MKMPFYEFEILDDAFQFDFFSMEQKRKYQKQ
jgi:hypothetical protein